MGFNDDYYEFYERKREDKIINIKKIPIYQIPTNKYLDIKNNSVWNYRFFFINYEKIFKNASDKEINEIIKNEIQYAIDKIQLCPVNESAYSYLRGYLNKYNKKYSDYPIIKETMLELMKKGSINHTLSMVVDIYEEEKNTAKAIEIIDELIILDYIRKKYWGWRKKQLE